jgi:hypothetical protein
MSGLQQNRAAVLFALGLRFALATFGVIEDRP